MNKIFFAYPTLYEEGMSREEGCVPSPLIANITSNDKVTIIVNVGMVITFAQQITIRTLVYPIGKPDLDMMIDDTGKFEHLKINKLPDNNAVFLSSLHLNSLNFNETGLYEISTSLLVDVGEDLNSGTVIDTFKSNFYVLIREDKNDGTAI